MYLDFLAHVQSASMKRCEGVHLTSALTRPEPLGSVGCCEGPGGNLGFRDSLRDINVLTGETTSQSLCLQ